MNTKYQIELDDLFKINELNKSIPQITEKYNIFKPMSEKFMILKRESRPYYKRNEKPPVGLQIAKSELYPKVQTAIKEYFDLMNRWNREMGVFIEKYDYVKLSDFLEDKPLPYSISKRPSHQFAINTKKIAVQLKIIVLKELYSGEPKLINLYPRHWISKTHEEIYKMTSNKEYEFDLMKFNV